MKILQPLYEIWQQDPNLLGIYKQIERAGRVCYKSEANITDDSAKPFVERMIKAKHYAMLEHGTVYLTCEHGELPLYLNNHFSRCNTVDGKDFITTNLRVLAENDCMGDLRFLCEPTECHARRITVHFVTQISVSREANRHRANSIAEQSTRYCNYSKNKFGGEISINEPKWVSDRGGLQDVSEVSVVISASHLTEHRKWNPLVKWLFANRICEMMYLSLVEDDGLKPQEARAILPLDTNTELVHTAFISDWQHFFDLRALGTTGAPHPDIEMLAAPLYADFKKQGFLKE